ncbi:MAG: SH3 domain-containing protein [Gemmatimonadota bacterium]|nr:SH3 domain-containing protein [Gemmatimonadota bacterium]
MRVVYLSRLSVFFLLAGILACQPNDSADTQETSEPESQVVATPAVNIWEGAGFREEPKSDGRWLSSLALGERVTFLGETATDSADDDREFYRLRLSDGREGWTVAYVVVLEAEPAAISEATSIYRRPDLLTVTENQFEPLDVIAVTGREGDWLEVVGNRRQKSGWIKSSSVSDDQVDIAVATLATNAFAEDDMADRQTKLEAILENSAFSTSLFIANVRDAISDIKVQGDSIL